MTKTEVITMFMNAVGQYTTAIDKTAESNISYKKSVYALEDAVQFKGLTPETIFLPQA